MRHLATRPHVVYIVWADDRPLYVGMTSDWWHRTGVHLNRYAGDATHIDAWHAATSRAEAESIERDVIQLLEPRDNYVHTHHDQFRTRRSA